MMLRVDLILHVVLCGTRCLGSTHPFMVTDRVDGNSRVGDDRVIVEQCTYIYYKRTRGFPAWVFYTQSSPTSIYTHIKR